MPNNLAAFQAEAWSKRILTRLDQVNVMLPLVNRDYEGEIKGKGSTVHVRTFGNVTMQPYTRNGTLSYENLAPSREPLTVNDAQFFAFAIDDLDEEQTDLNAMDGYAQRAAVAMNEIVDKKCLSKYAKTHVNNRITNGGSAYTLSTSNAYSLFVEAGKALDKQNVPQEGRWAVVGPNWKSKLLTDNAFFLRATDLGDQVLRSGSFRGQQQQRTARNSAGFLGQISNFDVYLSTGVPTDANGAYCQFGGGKVISYAGQLRKLQRIILESTMATAQRGLLLHDADVFAEHAKAYGYWLVDEA